MLFPGERRVFPSGAAGNQEIDSGFHLPADQPAQCRFVQRRILAERSDHSCSAPGKHVPTSSTSASRRLACVDYFLSTILRQLVPRQKSHRETQTTLFSLPPNAPRLTLRAQIPRGFA